MKRSVAKGSAVLVAAVAAAGFSAAAASAVEEPSGATCSSNVAVATLSPGIEATAKVQNVTVKGTVSGCTGSAGSSAKYVAHLKTTVAVSCATFDAEGAAAEGTVAIKWGHGHGNSQAALTATGGPETFALSGQVTQGPYAGLDISQSLSGTPMFSGKGEPCTKKNKLKKIDLTGTTPFSIA
jgi:hypothetical protein